MALRLLCPAAILVTSYTSSRTTMIFGIYPTDIVRQRYGITGCGSRFPFPCFLHNLLLLSTCNKIHIMQDTCHVCFPTWTLVYSPKIYSGDGCKQYEKRNRYKHPTCPQVHEHQVSICQLTHFTHISLSSPTHNFQIKIISIYVIHP